MKKLKISLLLMALAFAAISGCTKSPQSAEEKLPNVPIEKPAEQEALPAALNRLVIKDKPAQSRLVAVGDNLLHNTISFDAETSGGGYDFSPIYEFIKPIITSADIGFINQEVPLGGADMGIGKYPNLNAPQEAADALVDAGFNVINEASNHALDMGEAGLMKTLAGWRERNIAVIGAFETEQASQTDCILEKSGIKYGFLGYTYGTNGYPIPQDKPWLISLIDRDKIKADIERLRPKCEYLVVSVHWGTEYQTTSSAEQQELAQFIADCGADLIIGHHPHVIQEAQVLTGASGNTTFCAYSLGNFIASQQKKNTLLGGMLGVTVSRESDGKITTQQAGILPIMTHFEGGGKNYRVIPLEDYAQEMIAKNAVKKYDSPITLEYFNGVASDVLGEYRATKESFAWQK